jgi:pimeloyl-ACP methyl ester carboxylesterase
MKTTFLLLLSSFTFLSMQAQEISGSWHGILKVQGTQLRLVFNIEQAGEGYSATMDSPDQGARGIPVTSVAFEPPVLRLEVGAAGILYEGQLSEGEIISGTFKQAGISLPLDLSREAPEKDPLHRPQEPKEPYPYRTEEVTFGNPGAGVTLSGTLTLPEGAGPHPAVILISGSGPQNRDEEVFGHKPFLLIADHLSRKGIAVLRYDDRGTAESTGDFRSATSEDFASDVRSAISFLKDRPDIDSSKTGLLGHSEGGLIAPMVASDSEDIAFIILLAGPGVPGYDILLAQSKLIAETNGIEAGELEVQLKILKGALDLYSMDGDLKVLKSELSAYMAAQIEEFPNTVPDGMDADQYVKTFVGQMATPWMQYFITYDPAKSLTGVKCPVLALNGEKDLQVPSGENLEAISKYLSQGGNTRTTVQELKGLNHLFQECETGSPSEYANISQTFSPDALRVLTDWIMEQIR